ncbi:MAG: M61 family metallopeptidase, partial [Acidobacteria bacterium]|nr:M61 family metallopeptidase [Acidobacteriota bacterium]
MKALRLGCAIVLVLLGSSLLAGKSLAASPLGLQYRLSVTRPTTHLVEIEIRATGVQEPELDFVMPAWAPGRYAIYDFAKNVQDFRALGDQGQALNWTKTDKQTWRVETAQAGRALAVSYRVFGNDLTGSFSQIDSTHASLSGPSVFMYVDGHKPDPLSLSVDAPQGWKLISGYSLFEADRNFQVPNYDVLADTPLEISPDVNSAEFVEHGKTFRIAVHSPGEPKADIAPLAAGIRKFVAAQMAALPEPEFAHFTFLFHFDPSVSLGDGMEHLNSTAIILRQDLSGGDLAEALEIAAHEFFHVWNMKRLRPAGLGPFDYTREQYTRELWFAEGLTNYYSYVFLYRAGLLTRERLFARLSEEIRTLEGEPGRKVMSAESSSFHAWFYDRSPQMQETNFANTTISYYNKGAVLGLLLDLEIRARTEGRKSLDDVVLALYRKFYAAPAENYYLPGRGYTDEDILAATNGTAGSDFGDFFDRYIRGTEPLPYDAVLASAGLELRIATAPDASPSLGVLTERAPGGVRIKAVRPGGAAEAASLCRDDFITAVDGLSLETTSLRDRLA